jgi:UDP-2,4-diacetamido-2,4,6-trideoxy-beta-L-altropyranose hydrolase
MKVVFRVDASSYIGTGHLMRCLSLAEALRERGVQAQFICRSHKGHLISLLQKKAMPVTILPVIVNSIETMDGDYHAWLGSTQEEDAKQSIAALSGEKVDWLVIDHYGLDIEWEQQLRSHTNKLMVIDDLANRRHDCDILLDQNYSSEDGKSRYAELVSRACKQLLGPHYALLPHEYAIYRKTMRARDRKVDRVLVYFGGSDPHNVTALVLEALSSPQLRHLELDVVIGPNNPHIKALEIQSRERSRTKIYGSRPHLADLMAQADLAIGAGGTSTWERMCLGLPTLIISIAENQLPASIALAKAKLIDYAGHFSNIKIDHLTQLLLNLIHDQERLHELTLENQALVDGLGALRLVEEMIPSDIQQIRLRPASEQDLIYYYNWEKNSEVGKISSNASSIRREAYQTKFRSKLQAIDSYLFVFEISGLPVGQIRFDRHKDEDYMDYSLDPIIQERGWDTDLIALGLNILRQTKPVPPPTGINRRIDILPNSYLRIKSKEGVIGPDKGESFSIAILSHKTSWLNNFIPELVLDFLTAGHRVQWAHEKKELQTGDFCFYLGCEEIVPPDSLTQYRNNLVIHESDLPKGKGWSPLTWQILEGKKRIPITLFEAAEKIDSGIIYLQDWIEFDGGELVDELRQAQAKITIELCKRFIKNYPQICKNAREQVGEGSFYPRRFEMDSILDPSKSLEAQFNLLRVVDNQKYPAFFYLHGHRYLLRIDKVQRPST